MSRLHQLADSRFQQSIDLPLRFFEAEAEKVSLACLDMARRFHQNGRLFAFGADNARSDAHHIAVEFVHPVIVGKRALPAIALDSNYVDQLQALGQPNDIVIGIDGTGQDTAVSAGLEMATKKELLTIALLGNRAQPTLAPQADYAFTVPTDDPAIIQEIHETLYHILWELVHVFFDQNPF